ncbi:Ribosomal protein L29 [Giardia muris]|uniref:Ribosomal protein L29 n=1 Tax=Giardia muris TaxID=5742 RepID=A0A4Z1SYB3_GIAMU|nr:Ribosomal protein L29 [Giardia muris]|eukprot:TNJ30732.1 Ribosomal protein L29 [Giardia muris]
MPGLDTKELFAMTTEKLQEKLESLKRELLMLRTAKATAGPVPDRIARLRVCRKDIARVLTVITSKARESLREEYKDKKHIPKILRPKLTHAERLKLTPAQKSRLPRKTYNRRRASAPLKFALKKECQ